MSFHEGSNWQAKKEDEGKLLYWPEPLPDTMSAGTRTKEEILRCYTTIERRQSDRRMFGGYDFEYVSPVNALKAMEEYALQFRAAPPAGDGWISVEDGLPPKFKNVLALSKLGRIRITCVDSSGKLDLFELEVDNGDYCTHWHDIPKRPLPTPPKTSV